MKIQFLGTAAGEGWPGIFCSCEICKKALQLGGKNIRTRSQVVLNDDFLIDFPQDTYMHKLQHGLDLEKIKTLAVTHAHLDHFYPADLSNRGHVYSHTISGQLDIICPRHVRQSFDRQNAFNPMEKSVRKSLNWHIVKAFQFVQVNGYDIWSLDAKHMKRGRALFYLVQQGDKAYLHCCDTGYLYERNFAFLEKLGIKVDCIALDCTRGVSERRRSGHMCIEECLKIIDRMKKVGFTKPTTQYVVTHFSHNGGLCHEDLERRFSTDGIAVAYDGMTIEI